MIRLKRDESKKNVEEKNKKSKEEKEKILEKKRYEEMERRARRVGEGLGDQVEGREVANYSKNSKRVKK